ncbi:MAG: type II 3-dehydroquinate dehydratase [Longimicrobiales bacterium]
MKIALVHGPNLHLLGRREPEVYGTDTLDDVNARVRALAGELGVAVDAFQSNHEGGLIDWLTEASEGVDGVLINPGAFTHTSVALRDCLVGLGLPFVEVHLSNPASREPFRHRSYLSDVAVGVVYGFGADSYLLGLRGLVSRLNPTR